MSLWRRGVNSELGSVDAVTLTVLRDSEVVFVAKVVHGGMQKSRESLRIGKSWLHQLGGP